MKIQFHVNTKVSGIETESMEKEDVGIIYSYKYFINKF